MLEKIWGLIALCCVLLIGSNASAQYCAKCGRLHTTQAAVDQGAIVVQSVASPAPQVVRATPVRNAVHAVGQAAANFFAGSDDALDQVNAERARRGLRPFLPDPALNQAARACARIRASTRIQGHLPNDFSYVPAGSMARSAGCGALEPSWGWGTCCTYENYTYAGAAWVMGADGKRYMHLFVR